MKYGYYYCSKILNEEDVIVLQTFGGYCGEVLNKRHCCKDCYKENAKNCKRGIKNG